MDQRQILMGGAIYLMVRICIIASAHFYLEKDLHIVWSDFRNSICIGERIKTLDIPHAPPLRYVNLYIATQTDPPMRAKYHA
jgi:hypothetical protein